MDGKKIKEILAQHGISATEVARRVGMSQQSLSSQLSSDNIKTGTLEMVANAIGLSPASFYTGDNSGTAVVTHAERSTVIGKQETCAAAIAALERQLQVKDGQIDRLFGLLEGKK